MITAPDYKIVEHIGHHLETVPFDVSRKTLYSPDELYAGYDPEHEETRENCHDSIVYKHYLNGGKHSAYPQEALARSLHDHSILMALDLFLAENDPRYFIGIMGGHSLLRTDYLFRKITFLSKQLTEMKFLMISGGGPGAMEATHLGAWMAGRTDEEVDDALQMLSVAPSFEDAMWLNTAFRVIKKYQQTNYKSLGIPTWLYGHEPATPFATHIAKLFQNSIREDGLLKLAIGGVVYAPGSAGTMQEIFQDAVQNHYLTMGISSPMIFLDKQFWTEVMPVYPLLQKLTKRKKYKNLLFSIYDKSEDIIAELVRFRDANFPSKNVTCNM